MTTTYNVSSEGATFGNTDTTTLNGVIRTIDTGPVGNYVINITADISLTSALLAINLPSGSTLTIEGNNHKLDGGSTEQGLFVYAGTVTVDDLTIQNCVAQGGVGGNGTFGGGGGAGLGGGLFVAGTNNGLTSGGNVTLDNVTFLNDAAKGGNGGNVGNGGGTMDGGGGGGLNGGAGGSGVHGGGGGGIGGTASGGGGPAGSGGPGIVPGAAGGGSEAGTGGGSFVTNGGAGGGSGGGGGVATGGAGGGIGGSPATVLVRQFIGILTETLPSTGGTGGFGGGGGGNFLGGGALDVILSTNAGPGGFGGGGGSAIVGGAGGFGGGGGGGAGGKAVFTGGAGGFGGGGGGLGAGGGGLGAGGDIFVQQGGTLTIEGGTLSDGSVTPGAGGPGGAADGQAYGSGIFIQGDQLVVFAPPSGQTLTIADVIADMTGSADPSKQTGAGSVLASGGGTVRLMAHNTFTGGATVSGGTTVELAFSDSAGVNGPNGSNGEIVFGAGANTLQFDAAPTLPNNTMDNLIGDVASGDIIDLRDLTFQNGATAHYNAGTLTVTSGAITWNLDLDHPLNTHFTAVSDNLGGTELKAVVGPTLTGTANASFTENEPSVTLSPNVTVTDPNGATLVSATVQITGGTFANDQDVLAANTAGTGITASYNSSTETLTLTGTDTLGHYESVLDTVTFSDSGANPTDFHFAPARTLAWIVDDGSAASVPVTTTVSITGINNPPALGNVATTALFTEEGGAVALSSSVSVTDPDDLNLVSATVQITGGTFANDQDVLAANTAGTGITASYNSSTETLTLSGIDNLAHYRSVLDTVTFNAGEDPNNYGSNPTRTVVWTLNDGRGTANGGAQVSTPVTSTISVTIVNDPPTLSNVAVNANYTEGGAAATLSGAVAVTDPDDIDLSSATVAISGGAFAGDTLAANGHTSGTVVGSGGTITVVYNSTSETLTLTGVDTLTDYQALLDEVTFTSSSLNPTNYGSDPTRTVTWTLMDPGGTANGGRNTSTPVTSTISITPVNQAPTLSNVASSASVSFPGQTITISPSVSANDPDNLTLASATVQITGGTFANDGDVLAATTTGTSISASYNSSTETLTLSGSDTLVDYQQVLDSVTFDTTNPNTTNFGADKTRTVTWTVNDGAASNNLSAPAVTTISFQGAVPFDLNGDSVSDLVFQNNGQPGIWLWNGTAPITEVGLTNPGASWHIVTSRDVNGDGNADLIWQNTNGQPGIWLMNGTTPISEVGLANPGASWHIVASGDTNGDGKADLIWQESGGTLGVWEMNGTTAIAEVGLTNPGPTWKVVGSADFNNDGRDDILLQNSTNGNLMVDLMNGTSITSSVTISVGDPSWHAVSTGVFNGVTEIAWQNSNGTPGLWLMNGTTPTAEVGLPNPGSGWQLVSMDHFTPNGQADLLFQNSNNGAMQLWEMNGTNIAAEVNLPNPGAGWQSVNGHPFATG